MLGISGCDSFDETGQCYGDFGERRDAFACFASREGKMRRIHINGSGVPAFDAKKQAKV